MANTYLQRTESAGNRRTFTWSAWIKRSNISSSQMLAACSYSSSDEAYFFFNGSGKLVWQSSSASYGDVQTNRLFRDTNAWYHIVLAFDTTQAIASNRIRFYVNGVEETSFSNASYPNQDTQVYWNVGGTYYPRIGRRHAASDYFNGYMSHVAHIDGTQELPTIFGQYDANGVWTIKTTITPSSGWGTNGYWILKDGNSVTDQSGQGNNWTVGGGTLTNTEDSPSNVFATFNTLIKNHGATFTNGNLTYQSPASNPVFGSLSTLGMSSGKFYAECKYSAGSNHYLILGIADNNFNPNASTPDDLGKSGTTESIAYVVNTGAYRVNNSNTSWGSAGGDGDIIQIAVDCDNNKIFFGVNGTWGASSNPATGSNGIDVSSVLTGDTWFFGVSNDTSGTETIAQFNFGNGYFGTTAVSSAGTNASGNGIFEFDVPTGYTALSTKGLNL